MPEFLKFSEVKILSQVRKGGERFELLKADAEMQLEEANSRLAEVRLIRTLQYLPTL